MARFTPHDTRPPDYQMESTGPVDPPEAPKPPAPPAHRAEPVGKASMPMQMGHAPRKGMGKKGKK